MSHGAAVPPGPNPEPGESSQQTVSMLSSVCHRAAVPFGWRLHVKPVPCWCDLWHEPHQWLLHMLLCQRLQGSGLQWRHQWVWTGVSMWAWWGLCEHTRFFRVQLHAGLHRATMWDQREWVRVTPMPKWWLLPGWPRHLSLRLHARWVKGIVWFSLHI